jgi:hypothetical protein
MDTTRMGVMRVKKCESAVNKMPMKKDLPLNPNMAAL